MNPVRLEQCKPVPVDVRFELDRSEGRPPFQTLYLLADFFLGEIEYLADLLQHLRIRSDIFRHKKDFKGGPIMGQDLPLSVQQHSTVSNHLANPDSLIFR